jgi:iron complex transport system ATP-binding protein
MSEKPALPLDVTNLSVSVPGRHLVDSLNINASPGEIIAVLGRNGSGKTLTLHTLAGLRAPDKGVVLLQGTDIAQHKRQAAARLLALLPQVIDDIFPATVLDTALIGRHPHIASFSWESADDLAAAQRALAIMGLAEMHNRDILTLSGGERRRLAIAQVLAQAPMVYLLDEPTNHLDPQHQLETLQVFRTAADDGAVVIASLHDVNLAARFADRCLLLFGDGHWQLGDTSEVLNEESLSELYATRMEAVTWREQKLFVPASGYPAA